MLPRLRFQLCNSAVLRYGVQRYSTPAVTDGEAVQPVYPPIQDLSRAAKRRRREEEWYAKIKRQETVEEKLFELNMPRYYGWYSLLINEHQIPYNTLDHAQYITRTHVMKDPGLPAYYNNVIANEELDSIVQTVKSQIQDGIAFEHSFRERENELSMEDKEDPIKMSDIIMNAVTYQINRILLTNLSSKWQHLQETQVDYDPRLEAFWFVGGINPPSTCVRKRSGSKWFKEFANDPVTVKVQYIGQPAMHLRHSLPLQEIIPLVECEDRNMDVPQCKYNPKTLGYPFAMRHGTCIPGFWPGDQNEFGLLSYHKRGYLETRPKSFDDGFDPLTVQAIFASYSWLYSQACYQGFSTFQDVTYPLVTQTVITDGQWWSFFVYQLNTTLVHSEYSDENPKRNICWITEPMKLYDKVEGEKVYDFNEDVLKLLIKFYVNEPKERIGVNMKPYLGTSVKRIADIEHDERRQWLETHYKHLVSNRPRHRRIPEIPQWQRIFIFNHKTMPMKKKRDPWEFGIDVMKRRLDDHTPPYIPKCLRENPKKKKIGRFAKTYYPQ